MKAPSVLFLAAAGLLAAVPAHAINKGNAGPEEVTIKFKLPPAPVLTPESLAALLRDLNQLATTFSVDGRPLPLITPPSLRVGVRRLIEPVLPSLPVVSLAELPAQITLSSVATWEMN